MHLAPALPQRRFELEKNGLKIALVQITDARGALYTFWNVTLGDNTIKTGLFERDHGIPAMLKHIVDSVTMPTQMGDMALRTLTWSAMEGFEHVPASELRTGDEVAFGGGAFTVDYTVTPQDGQVLVMFTNGPSRLLKDAQLCNLTKRGPQA